MMARIHTPFFELQMTLPAPFRQGKEVHHQALFARLLALNQQGPGMIRVLDVLVAVVAYSVPGNELFAVVNAEPVRIRF